MTEKTILYIEDNFHNRRIVRKILERQGYTIYEAEDGIKGFNMLQELVPPVVLLDISLPGMDGIEIAKKVKADDDLKHIILIALTASAMQGDRERFLAAGCDDYLSKPFRAIGLVEMVNHHFENLPEQPAKTETPKEEALPLVSEEQDDAPVEFAVPVIQGLENLDATKTLGELPPFGEPLVEKKSVEVVPPVGMSLDAEDQAALVSKEIVEKESKQEEHIEPVTPVGMSLDAEDQATLVSQEIVEQVTEEVKGEPAEAVPLIETKASIEGNTKPLNELEVAAHEYLEKEEGVPTIKIYEKPKDLDRKTEKVTKTEPSEKAKTKAKPKTEAKAKAKTTKAKPKAKPKTKAKAKTKNTKAKLKVKPKTKAKAKTKTTKAKAQGQSKQAEKAAPVHRSLKADERTRPLWAPNSTEAEIVPTSNNTKSTSPLKSERKVNEIEGASIEEIMDNIVGMINSKILKPVDPNVDFND